MKVFINFQPKFNHMKLFGIICGGTSGFIIPVWSMKAGYSWPEDLVSSVVHREVVLIGDLCVPLFYGSNRCDMQGSVRGLHDE